MKSFIKLISNRIVAEHNFSKWLKEHSYRINNNLLTEEDRREQHRLFMAVYETYL